MRPATMRQYVGQRHLFGEGKPLRKSIEAGHVHSMILWGPPGVGKTTLAMILANYVDAQFLSVSAVLSGVKEIRAAIDQVREQQRFGRKTVLFVDEVHRFNKSQQDAFQPYIEDGTVIFIGAITENPSFELNNALLSRARVYVLKPLDESDVLELLQQAVSDPARGVGEDCPEMEGGVLQRIAQLADGDGRRALNLLEVAVELARAEELEILTLQLIEQAAGTEARRFDKGGDVFYDQISALHKAVRGSSPDGALYWFARMLDGGCDPLYIARRVVRMASEDIGNADPRALPLCLNAWDVQERLGSPEGELAIAQAVVYLACAPKSNAVYNAFKQVMAEVRSQPAYDVPMHLRNAPTSLMKSMDYGTEYRYAHDEPGGYAAGENYLPPELAENRYYHPVDRGLEQKIQEKLAHLRELDKRSTHKRYS